MQICSLLLLFNVIVACSGQEKTIVHQKRDVSGQSKIIRTQGTVSGNLHCDLQDKAGNIWFSTGGEGIYRYDGNSFTNFTTKDGLSSNDVNKIIQDKKGNILVGTKSGICKYDGKSFSTLTENDDPSKKSISSLLEDSKGNLWFGVWAGGIYRYDGKIFTNFLNNEASEKKFTPFPQKGDQPFNLGSQYQFILDILEDKKGNIWFSSWNGGGVWHYDGKSFKNYVPSTDYYKRNEDGRLGGDNNLSYEPSIFNHQTQDHICDDMIFSIAEDKIGNLWFATRNHGACRYDGASFINFSEGDGFVSSGVYSIVEDMKGNIWLTTEKEGVWCYDGKSFKNYTTDDGLVNNSVFSVLEDKNGNLWFGTRGLGLSRFDGKSFTTFSD